MRLLIVDSNGNAASGLARAAAKLDVDVHLVVHFEYVARVSAEGWSDRCLGTDLSDSDQAVLDICDYAERVQAAGIVTIDEYLTGVVQRSAAKLGLPGGSGPTDVFRNKIVMYATLSAAGVPVSDYVVIESSKRASRKLLDGIDYPCVVKPADSAGSTAVSVVTDDVARQESIDAALKVAKVKPYEIHFDRRAIVQRFIPGPEYSVESVVFEGAVHHVALTDKTTSSGQARVELAHVTRGVTPAIEQDGILRVATEALRALGLQDGVSHTEIIKSSEGYFIVEVAARVGGHPIDELVRRATGIDLELCAVQIALGMQPSVDPLLSNVAGATFIVAPSDGILAEVSGIKEAISAGADVELRAQIGSSVSRPVNNGGRLGTIITDGKDRESVVRILANLSSIVRVVIK